MMPSVLIVQPYIPAYRVEFFKSLRESLANRGIALTIAAASPTGDQSSRGDSAATHVHVPVRQIALRWGRREVLFRRLPRGWFGADLVVLEQATRNLETYLIIVVRSLFGKRVALWGHGTTITTETTRLTRRAQSWMLAKTDWLFAYTEGSAKRGVAAGALRERTTVVNNSIDVDGLSWAPALPDPPHVGEDRWAVAYIGGLDASKRIDDLLTIAERTYQQDPRFLIFVGGRGTHSGLVTARDHVPWLHYLGHVGPSHKRWMAETCQVILNPGRVGLVAIDSFALGLPIVTLSTTMHAPEFEYLTEKNSVIVDGIDEAVAALLRLMRDGDAIRVLREQAKRSADDFSLSSFVDRFTDGLALALSSPPRR